MLLAIVAAGYALLYAAGLFAKVPLPQAAPVAQSSEIYDVNGRVIGSFHGDQNRTLVDIDQISHRFKDAVVAAEDRTFYTHPGVSIKGIVRAAITNFRQGEIGQGASTITQQYARAMSGIGTERSYLRKLKEATLAVKIEKTVTKQKILENYLNTVYFGRGAYGAEAAAQTYFKKPAGQIDLAEAAYLAGVIRSPNRYQIERGPQGVSAITAQVLDAMATAGFIEPGQAEQAKAVDLPGRFSFGLSPELDSPKGGYFIEYVRKLLLRDFQISEEDLLGGGLRIHTTLDISMQEAAEEAVRSTLDRPEDPEVALIAMAPNGEVRAMVGGRVVDDPERARGFNFAANLPGEGGGRSPGSAFKPLALAAFVEEGKSLRSRFFAPPLLEITSPRCRNADGTPWKISNFEDQALGELDLVEATTKSANTVYAQVMDQVVTPAAFVDMAQRAGIEIPRFDHGCALTLGTTDVTPLEMARAYSTFANRGRRPEPLFVLRVEASDGTIVAERKPRTEQTIDPEVAETVSWVLKQNVQRGTGTGARLPWPAMGKTGTAQNHADASFAGSTPELTTVVWMGYAPSGTPPTIPVMTDVRGIKVTGGSFPATIWKKFMVRALAESEHGDFPEPKGRLGEVLSPSPIPCPSPSPGPSAPAPISVPGCTPAASPSPSISDTPAPQASAFPEPNPPPKQPPPACLLGILCPLSG
ncbi:MAG: transglycosylase domain-containing protein [Actinomycetota bacterium]